MLKNNPTQLEMFQLNEGGTGNNPIPSGAQPHMQLARKYRQVIWIMVGCMFTSLISFSLGVEKGKKQAIKTLPGQKDSGHIALQDKVPSAVSQSFSLPQGRSSDAAAVTVDRQPPAVTAAEKKQPERKPAFAEAAAPEKNKKETVLKGQKAKDKGPYKAGSYTIQVASIAQSKHVNKELTTLKSRGYTAFSLEKGKYTVICVGKFPLREEAQNIMQRLKNTYPDCQIRRL